MSRLADQEKPYSVSDYLDLINESLSDFTGRVQGEVTELSIRSSYLFFSLKDKDDGSLLSCFMWQRDYKLCGVTLEDGLEIVAEGFPEVYKPSGRLSLRASVVELVGEGVLKKAYDKLHKKLKEEGLFAEERKRPLPDYPQKIGVITSASGRVIKDFLNNLGKYGFKIKMIDSRVEGQAAVVDLLAAIGRFKGAGLDVLVIIRGGGSLESLQAFNNESLVRAIADFEAPVICGIGHAEDVPLASLAADHGATTPTAAAIALNRSWSKLSGQLAVLERDILSGYQKMLAEEGHKVEGLAQRIRSKSDFAARRFKELKIKLAHESRNLARSINEAQRSLQRLADDINAAWVGDFKRMETRLDGIEKRLKGADPRRQLALGYSIAFWSGKVIRSVDQVKPGMSLDIRVADGVIGSKVELLRKNDEEAAHGRE